MLYYVSGPVTVLEPGLAVIDCGGVGYGCRITAYTAGQLKLNQNARLYITESIREDAFGIRSCHPSTLRRMQTGIEWK